MFFKINRHILFKPLLTKIVPSIFRRILFLLICCGSFAFSQDEPPQSEAGNAQRISVEKDGNTTRIRVDSDISIKLKVLPPPKTATCQAAVSISYEQRNTFAHVDGTLTNTMCTASSGNYQMSVTFSDPNNEIKILEFNSAWQRSDYQDVSFSADYEIGDNVDLIRVRTRQVSCVCADAVTQ